MYWVSSLFIFILAALGASRAINDSPPDLSHPIPPPPPPSSDITAGTSPNDASDLTMKPPSPPDCAFLPYHVTQDPKWDNSTDKYARCVCRGATMFTMECEIEIPNDHVIDRAAVSQSRDRCGSSVYNAIDRLSSWKAGRKCILSHDNVANLRFTTVLLVAHWTIQEGFMKGTCGAFPNVVCDVDMNKPPGH